MIFDEPTLGLDVMTARTIVQFIRHCRQEGKTVIVSTHVMSEAGKLCDRIGIIERGCCWWHGMLAGTIRGSGYFVRVLEGQPCCPRHRDRLSQGTARFTPRPADDYFHDRGTRPGRHLLMFGVGTLAFKTMAHAREEIPRVMIVGGQRC